jgi:two-component system cell cycle sensor histidine kinase PleC
MKFAAATLAVALAIALGELASDGALALMRHPLVALGALVLAVASAVALGIELGRGESGETRPSAAIASPPPPVEPGPDQTRFDAMSRAETEFLANMSHELRTPLNAVIGFAELILDGARNQPGNPRHVAYARHIRAGGEQVLSIVDAILDMSQLASGQVKLQPRHVEPRAVAEECARSVAAQAEAARVELEVRPTTASPLTADPACLTQALTNLMSNAVKFTRPGGRVSISATDCEHDAIAFEVTDTGIGMTPGEVAVAMQPFRTVERSMTRRHGGIGLGLPLAERLVRLHGGKLRIDSRPGCGTTVTAILPRAVPANPASGDVQ